MLRLGGVRRVGRPLKSPRLFRMALLVLGLTVAGCSKRPDLIVHASDRTPLTDAAIDADPLALLPGNPVGALTLDTQALFASRFGSRLQALVQAHAPLPAEANFEPPRDLERIYVGFYSMQGVDAAGIAVGRFEPERIATAAASTLRTSAGRPIAVSQYARRTLYTSDGMGFTPLTARCLLFGNEVGIRRALDRIEEGRVKRRLPTWMVEQLSSPEAPITGGADLAAYPVTSALREQLAFVDGLRTISLLGNFRDPGLNLAGTLSYDTSEAALRGSNNLKQLHASLSSAGLLMALVGVPQPLRKLDAQASAEETRFVAEVDSGAVFLLLEKILASSPQRPSSARPL